jgi:hypothetical protein
MMLRSKQARLASLFNILRARGFEPGTIAGWGERTERNYQIICNSGTKGEMLPFACVCIELLAAHAPDTVRGNMYLVVSKGWLPDTSKTSYNKVQRLLNRLRINGTIPFEWIVDNVRSTIKPSSWSGLADFADTVRDTYRKDFWAQLPEYVEVIVEKDTVAGKVSPVTEEYDVRLHPIRGYNSTTFAYNIARYWQEITKPIYIYYIGDHDPSGRDLERDIREKAARFSGKQVNWVRLAVNPEHFEEFNIPPLAPKRGDKRTPKFIQRWGKRCAEVEGIPATALRQIVREAIERHIPAGEWERLKKIEQTERDQWTGFMKKMKTRKGGKND